MFGECLLLNVVEPNFIPILSCSGDGFRFNNFVNKKIRFFKKTICKGKPVSHLHCFGTEILRRRKGVRASRVFFFFEQTMYVLEKKAKVEVNQCFKDYWGVKK